MHTDFYDNLTLEQQIDKHFATKLDIAQIILNQIDISRTARATLFLNSKKQLFVFIEASSSLLLTDIKRLISRMHLRPETFIPPQNDRDYFDNIGKEKFLEVFPGRANISEQDIMFYRTLAPYNPALVKIAEVINGEIYQFDADSSTNWRPAIKFNYKKITTIK